MLAKALNGYLAIVALLLALLSSGDLVCHQIETGFTVTPAGLTWFIDPVFVVWSDSASAGGMAFGNTIIMQSSLRDTQRGSYVLRYELNHVRQCRALGFLMWPASLFVDMDPFRGAHPVEPDWANPAQPDSLMWLPPKWWPDLWHFLRLELRVG